MASPSIGDLLARAQAAPPEHQDVTVILDRAVAEKVEALQQRIDATEAELEQATAAFEDEREQLRADQRMSDPRPAELDARQKETTDRLVARVEELERERDTLTESVTITFRFTKLAGQAWSELTSRNPARVDVGIDRLYGYNYHEAAKQASAYIDDDGRRYGQRVIIGEDGAEALEDLTPEQWRDLWPLLAGGEFERIATTLFNMNDWGPRTRAEAAKKASRVGSAK